MQILFNRLINGEKWIRDCPFCGKKQVCNVCSFHPANPLNHQHKFEYIKTLIKRNFLKRLFNKELRTEVFSCLCGETKQKGDKIKLPSDWRWEYA